MRNLVKQPNLFIKMIYMWICISLVMPINIVNAAATTIKADTEVKHESPGSYIPGFRIRLQAEIKDSAGIMLARCYFKTKKEKNFSFVDMKPIGGGNNYIAVLPAPWINSREIDYTFLTVNKAKKVVRTQIFKMKEQEVEGAAEWKGYGKVKMVRLDRIQEAVEEYEAFRKLLIAKYKDNLPDYQMMAQNGKIEVKTEIDPSNVELNGIYDQVVLQEVPMSLKYGLLVDGLYTTDAVAAAGGSTAAAQATGATGAGVITASTGGISAGWIVIGALVAGGAAGGIAAASGGGGGGGGDHHDDHTSQTSPSSTPPASGGTGGLSNVTVGQRNITIEIWDDAAIDGDQIDMILNGNTILSNYVLTGSQYAVHVHLNPGVNVLTVHADNQGSQGPNTAALHISNVTQGSASQHWAIYLQDPNASMTITAP